MNLMILGATGGTGRHVVDRALSLGHRATAVVRDRSRITARDGLRIELADLDHPPRLAAILEGHDAVLCVLGAPGRDRSRVRTRGTAAALQAMHTCGVSRIVALSSFSIGDSRSLLPMWIRYGLVPLFLGPGFADHEEQEKLLQQSGLDWTIVRPPFLTDDAGGTDVTIRDDLRGTKMKIPRADVARVMVDAVSDPRAIRRVLAVASA